MTKFENENFNYIIQHRKNIKLAFYEYGIELCDSLNIEYNILKKIIENHDKSKFDDEEFECYRQYFYPEKNEVPNRDIFNMGWLHHQNYNKHHPEYWILRDDNKIIPLDMDNYSIAEMLLDWEAVSMYQHTNTYDWYCQNKSKIIFSDITRQKVNKLIKLFK